MDKSSNGTDKPEEMTLCMAPGVTHPVPVSQLDPRYVNLCRNCADQIARWGCE